MATAWLVDYRSYSTPLSSSMPWVISSVNPWVWLWLHLLTCPQLCFFKSFLLPPTPGWRVSSFHKQTSDRQTYCHPLSSLTLYKATFLPVWCFWKSVVGFYDDFLARRLFFHVLHFFNWSPRERKKRTERKKAEGVRRKWY